MKKYASAIENKMKRFYDNLSEKDKRHYSAIEALKLGHGGIIYAANLFGCARQTVSKGLQELTRNELLSKDRIRYPGGGRKNHQQRYPKINNDFLKGD